jgi:LysM repeat protein
MTPIIIKVYDGQTIEEIAKNYHLPVSLLKQYNDIKDDISEGDRLVIPFEVRAVHIVKPLETLAKIAKLYDTSIEKIKNDNNLIDAPFIGQQLMIL